MSNVTTTHEKPYGRKPGATELPANLPLMMDPETGARLISTSSKFVRDRCADGTIKAVKCGRVWRINRDAFLEQYGLKEA